ncbi:MAG: BMP family ABC transporter substrate-binding protein [Candidatus Omnitrophica bacterium]|nr:BMP family ABC transporter substrate-binding protein [Candidatus Omnitrophota bacterium]
MIHILGLLLCIIISSLAGCSGAVDAPSSEGFNAILITDIGGLGDKGFNDSGWAGCQIAQKQIREQGGEIDVQFIESEEQTDYSANLNMAAERADVVVALGFLIADAVDKVASYNPGAHFILVDAVVHQDNVAGIIFRANEGAFLAGLLASYVSQTGTVAVMPGMDIPPVDSFAVGYRAGALTGGALQDKEMTILSTTIGSFDDPVKAKSIAVSLMDQKADIILQLAGNSGLGVIEAVKDAPGRAFAIGVDIDQDDLAPGKILTSILKRMDRIVAREIVAAYNREFQGGLSNVGLKEDAVGLSDMRHTRQFVPEEAFSVMDQAKKRIIEGKLEVPRLYEELDSFDAQSAADLLKSS